jgi:hypothetical protein
MITRTPLLFVGLMTLVACSGTAELHAEPAPTHAPPSSLLSVSPILRTYDVGDRAFEIHGALVRALASQTEAAPFGSVARLGDTQLVVVGPPSLHEGVERLCETTPAMADTPSPSPTITLSYWLVVTDTGDDTEGHDRAVPDFVRTAIGEPSEDNGAAGYRILESAAISSLAGSRGKGQGTMLTVEQSARVDDGSIVADVDLQTHAGARLSTRIALKPGETMVVGQGHFDTRDGAPPRLYHVVRADLG